jgi:hypothetical protein
MDRRRFLILSGALAASSCVGDKTALEPAELNIVPLFSPTTLSAGAEHRLTFGLVRNGAMLSGDDLTEVHVRLVDQDSGETVTEATVRGRVTGHAHAEASGDGEHEHGNLVQYFAPSMIIPQAGGYRLIVTSEGAETQMGFNGLDATSVAVPGPGQAMPAIETPTLTRNLDVSPICTRSPACEFHTQTPAELIAGQTAFALLIATPQFCQTAFCGPVLELLIAGAANHRDLPLIHAEVYANPAEVGGNLGDPALRPSQVLADLALTFEPSLFVVGRDGLIKRRLDNVLDADELDEALRSV